MNIKNYSVHWYSIYNKNENPTILPNIFLLFEQNHTYSDVYCIK